MTADAQLSPPAPTGAADRDALHCPRCGRPGAGFAGCPSCRAEGVAVNLELALADASGLDLTATGGGPWAWRQTLPLDASTPAVRLGEGGTPVVAMPAHGGELLLKMECANPTGSHKDRALSVAITRGRELGFSACVIISAGSTGLSTAAYAARAGTSGVPPSPSVTASSERSTGSHSA